MPHGLAEKNQEKNLSLKSCLCQNYRVKHHKISQKESLAYSLHCYLPFSSNHAPNPSF